MAAVLDRELRTYDHHRDRLLGSDEGRFVLIKDDRVCGIYDSKMDAIAAGYQQFGNVPFLVKQILKIETPQSFVSNLLGV